MSSAYRFKIGLTAAILVIVLDVIFYVATVIPLSSQTDEAIQNAVKRANSLVIRRQRLYGYDILSQAQELAREQGIIHGVQTETEKQRRINVYDMIMEFHKKLAQEEGRKADFLGVVDKEGAIIARDLDPNSMYGEKLLNYQNVKKALEGVASKDLWWMKNIMLRTAAVPIWDRGKIHGAVIIGYEVTASEARSERDEFGAHVAYFVNNTIHASSFSTKSDDNTEDSEKVGALSRTLLGSADAPGQKVIDEDKPSDLFKFTLQGEDYLAIAGPLPLRLTDKRIGYVVLSSIDAAQEPLNRLRWAIFLAGLIMLVLVLGGMWLVAKHFLAAEDKVELGVAEVINGNLDYTFEAVEEFEGLANGLNVMLARLLGRPEPGEEEDGDMTWRSDVITIDEMSNDPADAALANQLAAEPEDAYYSRVFQEYVDARRQLDLPIDGITLENLTQKLKANEGMLKAKHKCQGIRFVVRQNAGKATFKPIRLS